MRYAIVSDIHANLQAWKAVLIDIRSLGADRILCLGDAVGYGPNPAETLRSLYTNVHDFVLGNHDAAVCGKIDENLFNDNARRLLGWTRSRLNRQATQFFDGLPLSLTGPGFRCAHGEFAEPARFGYVIEPADALRSWQSVTEPLLFVGHTHQPGIFVIGNSGRPHRLPPQDFIVEPGKRFLVNVGSVGQSRDGDTRASYLVYDTNEHAVFWRRIPFDLDAFKAALDETGLGDSAAAFLAYDPRRHAKPLREMLGFNPPAEPDAGVRDTLTVRQIKTWQHQAGLWRKRCAIMAGLALAGSLCATALYWQYGNPAINIMGKPMAQVKAAEMQINGNLLPPLQFAPARTMPPGWHCRLGNRLRQSAAFISTPDTPVGLRLNSDTKRVPIKLSAATVLVEPAQRLQLRAMIRKTNDFSGSIAVVVGIGKDAESGHETVPRFHVQEPTLRRSDGWEMAQRTFTIPAGGEKLYYSIDGNFTGTVEIRDIELLRR